MEKVESHWRMRSGALCRTLSMFIYNFPKNLKCLCRGSIMGPVQTIGFC